MPRVVLEFQKVADDNDIDCLKFGQLLCFIICNNTLRDYFMLVYMAFVLGSMEH